MNALSNKKPFIFVGVMLVFAIISLAFFSAIAAEDTPYSKNVSQGAYILAQAAETPGYEHIQARRSITEKLCKIQKQLQLTMMTMMMMMMTMKIHNPRRLTPQSPNNLLQKQRFLSLLRRQHHPHYRPRLLRNHQHRQRRKRLPLNQCLLTTISHQQLLLNLPSNRYATTRPIEACACAEGP